jgi:hypothetical protein
MSAELVGGARVPLTDVSPRQQLVDSACWMTIGDFVEDVGEPGLRIDIVHFAGFDQ